MYSFTDGEKDRFVSVGWARGVTGDVDGPAGRARRGRGDKAAPLRALSSGLCVLLESANAPVTGCARGSSLGGWGFKEGECVGVRQRERSKGVGVKGRWGREASKSRM